MTINDREKKALLDASDTLARRKLLSVTGAGTAAARQCRMYRRQASTMITCLLRLVFPTQTA
ncbi:hypothetical protein [Pseudomonas chlororaphis]|uniref:Uncharacterized protein n=1 Tax=Pseudomonas chlororaphis TaxID=587753 RepID=A0AAX3FUP1_9PSED|nr:hypothetical protein [Pseudomonas chlororaphis]AZC39437.1 hypothetical protein C4K37_5072 [Pseudomonas chlororaphis subsp. piscium]AZC45989.1 hypothetical protein C4K36_5086 [Pseudomonas chlororaphis subsp. piscium]AZC52724.1 hypothetical protein C4K35_5163 [Pseudomonas chlororaphis subsp. piscium]QHC91359.1 hypothetical protein PchlR47_24690 [Pseudomonas chlororaphis]WDG71522.1 hypothetical protein PUP65_25990 [Pseudomonas chlororaphis]